MSPDNMFFSFWLLFLFSKEKVTADGGTCLDLLALNVSTNFARKTKSFRKIPPHSARRSLNPEKCFALGVQLLYSFITLFSYLPTGGLEPPRISSYAPETHVSTIPPRRHIFLHTILKQKY